MTLPPKIEFMEVGQYYGCDGDEVAALRDINFSVAKQEFVCVLGPSGCGKSTLLHLAAGFLKPSAGKVLIDGREVSGPGIDRGVVFQQHNLFPWETISGNVEFGLRIRGVPKEQRQTISSRYLREVGLSDFATRYPRQLSLGMQQRVGLARAFANDPQILLLDEPFASLDALARLRMQELLLDIWAQHRKTVIFVTHDVDEALLLGDRLLILSPRPGCVARELVVELPRPRKRTQLLDARLISVKEDVLAQLMSS